MHKLPGIAIKIKKKRERFENFDSKLFSYAGKNFKNEINEMQYFLGFFDDELVA